MRDYHLLIQAQPETPHSIAGGFSYSCVTCHGHLATAQYYDFDPEYTEARAAE